MIKPNHSINQFFNFSFQVVMGVATVVTSIHPTTPPTMVVVATVPTGGESKFDNFFVAISYFNDLYYITLHANLII